MSKTTMYVIGGAVLLWWWARRKRTEQFVNDVAAGRAGLGAYL